MKSSASVRLCFFVICGVGLFLRILSPDLMEYKGDEAWIWETIEKTRRGEALPLLGAQSSQGMLSPGLGIWVLYGIAGLFNATSPMDLASAVGWMSWLSLLGFGAMAIRQFQGGERETWLWAVALMMVNPVSVVLGRKIWPIGLYTGLTLPLIWGWLRQERRWGAGVYGLSLGLIGQLHIAGVFMGFSLVVSRFLLKKVDRPRTHPWFYLGLGLAAFPALPWGIHLFKHFGSGQGPVQSGWTLDFWKHWVETAFGLNLDYSVGHHLDGLLGGVWIWGWIFQWYLWIILGVTAILALKWSRFHFWVRPKRANSLARSLGDSTGHATEFLIFSGWVVCGGILTLLGVPIHVHYLFACAPLFFVSVAWVWMNPRVPRISPVHRRTVLLSVVLVQLGLTLLFLRYIDRHEGAEGADYGKTIRSLMVPR